LNDSEAKMTEDEFYRGAVIGALIVLPFWIALFWWLL
jgi:hypothetical protein